MIPTVRDDGTYSYSVGAVQVIVVHDGMLAMPRPLGFMRDVSEDVVEPTVP